MNPTTAQSLNPFTWARKAGLAALGALSIVIVARVPVDIADGVWTQGELLATGLAGLGAVIVGFFGVWAVPNARTPE